MIIIENEAVKETVYYRGGSREELQITQQGQTRDGPIIKYNKSWLRHRRLCAAIRALRLPGHNVTLWTTRSHSEAHYAQGRTSHSTENVKSSVNNNNQR